MDIFYLILSISFMLFVFFIIIFNFKKNSKVYKENSEAVNIARRNLELNEARAVDATETNRLLNEILNQLKKK